MATVVFTPNIQRHIACPQTRAVGTTVRQVLDAAFAEVPEARAYILDDQGGLRRHMMIFIDGQQITDPTRLSDQVGPDAEIYVMQALSGG